MTFETTFDASTGLFDTHRVDAAPFVPGIKVVGNRVSSNARLPRAFADNCAMWIEADRKRALRLIGSGKEIRCEDATAYAAVIAMNLNSMLRNGKYLPLSRIVKEYEAVAGVQDSTIEAK